MRNLKVIIYYKSRKHSLYIYARPILKSVDFRFNLSVHQYTLRKYKKQMRKDYLSLNWPMFVLFFVASLGSGILIFLFSELDSQIISSFAISAGFLSLAFFFPFYLNNMIALFDKYQSSYRETVPEVAKNIYNRLQVHLSQTEEVKKRLEEALNHLQEQKDENEDN